MNIIVITSAIVLSGLAIYNTACVLVGSMGNLNDIQQAQFNSVLFNYLLIFVSGTIITASLLHYYLTRKLVNPVQKLIESTKQMEKGEYPAPVPVTARGEIGELTEHFNGLVDQLKANDADRSKMISDLSHEVRTPLTNLNGYLKALRDGVVEGDTELYQSLLNESKRITEMIEQMELLKEWGEISSHHYTEYETRNIAALIEQCAGMFQLQLGRKNISLITDAEDCTFRLNAEGVQQVMTNLIDNALNHYEDSAPIQIKGSAQGGLYHVSVSAPGPAIPDKEKERIFERLYRLDTSRSRETGGHGLGLAIVKEIIDKHNGQIRVSSEDGINTFCFTLPIR
ncbi:sensor histidine kinase [Salinicoccus halodurans]|uniref:histidine kinase n=1 Tax=Salinicoccus halodurans TaxID=407035 RepID=A0AA94HI94_9STAP|nr:HAMP domain-containing sensor histidine kinase [Salinicoccus halodurans]SFK88783.1 two-component system, OmpR family, sensor histidine kinase BaeS [Salinicoccus halodurans]